MQTVKVFSVSELNNILNHRFKTEKILDSGNCVGYTIKLERGFLPIHAQAGYVSGADVMAMLAKLTEWEKSIEEVRRGLLQIIEEQLPVSGNK